MISALDILYLALAIAIIITAVLINMILYNVYRSIRGVRKTTENAFNLSKSILTAKQRAKLTFLKKIKSFLTSK